MGLFQRAEPSVSLRRRLAQSNGCFGCHFCMLRRSCDRKLCEIGRRSLLWELGSSCQTLIGKYGSTARQILLSRLGSFLHFFGLFHRRFLLSNGYAKTRRKFFADTRRRWTVSKI